MAGTLRSMLCRASRLSAAAGRSALALAAARALPAATSRLAGPGARALSDVAAEMDGEPEEPMPLSSPALSRAIQLLVAQEDQGVAADASQDGLMHSLMLNPRLSDAILAYFTAQKDRALRTAKETPGRVSALGDAYASLIYACVKMRKLDLAFEHHDAMRSAGVPVDARVYASLLKGCGRAKKIKRGESFFRTLLGRGERAAREATVYNALLNMYTHQLPRPLFLSPHHVADSWRVFNEMVAQGIMPNEVTYNSLISLCNRTRSPDVRRAEMILAEMQAVGVPPSNVTVSALMQVYGRADSLRRGRDKLAELQKSGVAAETSFWRPLLHRVATRGNVAVTEEIIEEMKRHTGKEVFDTFRYKPCYVRNYRMMAVGHSLGFEAALTALNESRAAGQTDALTYNFLIDVALGTGAQSRRPSADRVRRANQAWDMMLADGLRPSIALCHRMLGVWAHSNQLDKAEAAFESMRAASGELLKSSASLAALWEAAAADGGDLSLIAEQLAGSPLLTLGHNFTSYVRMVEACVHTGAPAEHTAKYVWSAMDEAAERGVSMPWHVSEAMLRCLTASPDTRHREASADPPPPADAALVDLARQLHLKLAEEGGRPPPGGSVAVVSALMRAGHVHDAARALLAAGDLAPDPTAGSYVPAAFWPFSMLQQRQAELEAMAEQMPEGDQREATLAVLKETAPIFGEEQPQAAPSRETAGVGQAAGHVSVSPDAPDAAPPPVPALSARPKAAPDPAPAREALQAQMLEPAAPEAPGARGDGNEPLGDSAAASAGGSRGGHQASVAASSREASMTELSRRLAEAAEADEYEQCAEIEAEIKRLQDAGGRAKASRVAPSRGPQTEELRKEGQKKEGAGKVGQQKEGAGQQRRDLERRLAAAVAEEEFEVAAELEAEMGKLSA